MSKQLLMTGILGVFIAGSAVTAQAQMHEDHGHKGSMAAEGDVMAHEGEGKTEMMNVGNTVCPVSGQKVGEMGDVVEVEYDGKVYNLCCSMCKKDFLKNPEKYSKIAEEQAAQTSESEKGHGHMQGEGHGHDH